MVTRTGAIIQVRYNSTRFPGKVLRTLPFDSDKTIIGHIYNRLKQVPAIDEVIVATSDEPSDDVIERYCKQRGYVCVRGDKDNVLSRFVKVIKELKLDNVVRVTGDNPVVLVDIMEKAIQSHISSGMEYTRNNNLPYGTSFEIVKSKILEQILANPDVTESDREHVTIYIRNNKNKFGVLEIEHEVAPLDFRFTIDYPSDYAVMNIVFQFLAEKHYEYDLETLSTFVTDNLWLKSINSANLQKKQFEKIEDELVDACRVLKELDYHHSADVLKNYIEDTDYNEVS